MYYIPVLLLVSGMAISRFLGTLPLLVPAWYLLTSLIAYIAYAKDKRAALKEDWRVSEGTLHFMSLLGGWPGATVAQQLLRHKTRKTEFRVVYWFTVFANSGVLIWLHTSQGASKLQSFTAQLERLVRIEVNHPTLREGLMAMLAY